MGDKPKLPDAYERYRFHELGTHAVWSEPVEADKILEFMRDHAVEGQYQLSHRVEGEEEWSELHGRKEAFEKVAHRITKAKVGDTWLYRPESGTPVWAVRKVHIKPEIMDTAGTPAIDVMHTAVMAEFKDDGVQSWGICCVRKVAGSSSWSQHAYCNAEDWHASSQVMRNIADFLVKNAEKLNVRNVIYDHHIWYSGSWHSYGGENPHVDHVHVDMNPPGTGDPRK